MAGQGGQTRRDRARRFYDSMLILSLDSITHKLKLDLNLVTIKVFTKINLNKALLVKREKSSSIVTKL